MTDIATISAPVEVPDDLDGLRGWIAKRQKAAIADLTVRTATTDQTHFARGYLAAVTEMQRAADRNFKEGKHDAA